MQTVVFIVSQRAVIALNVGPPRLLDQARWTDWDLLSPLVARTTTEADFAELKQRVEGLEWARKRAGAPIVSVEEIRHDYREGMREDH